MSAKSARWGGCVTIARPGLGPVTMELLFDPPDHERLPDNDAGTVDRALAVQICPVVTSRW